jgi:hypothetical protein
MSPYRPERRDQQGVHQLPSSLLSSLTSQATSESCTRVAIGTARFYEESQPYTPVLTDNPPGFLQIRQVISMSWRS